MNSITINPPPSLSLFVKNILVLEAENNNQQTVLPFYADGYPGLMFHQTTTGLLVNPHQKQMPALFLYGQTIKPIELVMEGAYQLIVFQLYPFVLRSFFGVNPIDINDGCYDLEVFHSKTVQQLQQTNQPEARIAIINAWLQTLFQTKKESLDFTIQQAIQFIDDNKGRLSIDLLSQKTNTTKRTLERRFLKEVGISPKQFSKIIQFQHSFEQLRLKEYDKLTDIVYTNGFADQSHFIRVFKAYTGSTPKKFDSKS
jgi:AraC-like DNA-binding protein